MSYENSTSQNVKNISFSYKNKIKIIIDYVNVNVIKCYFSEHLKRPVFKWI